jgi:hypothetical protein
MFNKKDRVFVTRVDPNTLMQTLQGTLAQLGYQPAGPAGVGYMCVGAPLGYGVIPKVLVNVMPAQFPSGQGGHVIDVDVRSDIDQSSLIIAIVLAFFFFPIAAILAFVAYQNFEQHATYVVTAVRNSVGPYMAAPPAGPMPYPYPPA